MQANIVRQALKQLPLQQRAVAIALKKIYDQIKQLTRKQQQEIDANHLGFISRFKQLQKKSSDIIQGKVLTQEELDSSDTFFSEVEIGEKQKLMKENNKIQNYWLQCLQNSQYGPELNQQQKRLLPFISDIQTNITTNSLNLIIKIQSNPILQNGVFTRRLILDNGMAISFQGQQPKFKQLKQEGILNTHIFTNTKSEEGLAAVFKTLGPFVNQIVPYSLQYYLGALDQGEDEELEEEDEEEDEEKDE